MIAVPITSRLKPRRFAISTSVIKATWWVLMLTVMLFGTESSTIDPVHLANDSVTEQSNSPSTEPPLNVDAAATGPEVGDGLATHTGSAQEPGNDGPVTTESVQHEPTQHRPTVQDPNSTPHPGDSESVVADSGSPATDKESSHSELTLEEPTQGSNASDNQGHTPKSIHRADQGESPNEHPLPPEEEPPKDNFGGPTTPPPPPIGDGVDLSQHDMMDFDDFRKEYLGKDPKPNGNGKKGEAKPPNGLTISTNIRPNAKLRNFASAVCGAKIISSTKDAVGPQSVLNENRDEYMNQPCSAKKWVTMELCQPVLIRRVELANLELFSSTFRNFSLYIDRLGAQDRQGKEWQLIGSFQAKDERQIQMFQTPDISLFTLFVKIEFHSHYGKEHYCPITLLRVFGVAVDDDDDGEDDDDDDDNDLGSTAELTNANVDSNQQKTELTNENAEDNLEQSNGVDLSTLVWLYVPTEGCARCFTTWQNVPPECHCTATVNESNIATQTRPPSKVTEPVTRIEPVESCKPSESPSVVTSDLDAPSIAMDTPLPEPSHTNPTTQVPVASEQPQMKDTESELQPAKDQPEISTNESMANEEVDFVLVEPSDGDERRFADLPEIEPLPMPPTEAQNSIEDTNAKEPQAISDQEAEPEPRVEEQNKDKEDTSRTGVEEKEEEEELYDDSIVPPKSSRNHLLPAIGKLSNRVSELEINVTLTTKYLEEMSRKYKNQKEELQKALNRTMKALQNVTVRFDDLFKNYSELSQNYITLTKEVEKLQRQNTEGMDTIPLMIALTVFTATILVCCRRPRDLTQHQMEELIASMPTQPRVHERRGSESTIEFTNSIKGSKPHRIKKCKSTVELKTVQPVDESDDTADTISHTADTISQHSLSDGLPPESFTSKLKRKAAMTRIQLDKNTGDSSDDQSTETEIEIIHPARWRTFDTPASKKSCPPRSASLSFSINPRKHSHKKSRGDLFNSRKDNANNNSMGKTSTVNTPRIPPIISNETIHPNSHKSKAVQNGNPNNSMDQKKSLTNGRAHSSGASEHRGAKSNGHLSHTRRKHSPKD